MADGAHEGGCLCRAVRYRVEGPAAWVNLCFCENCRRAVGGPAVAFARFARARFALLAGEPACFRSSPEVTRSFCGTCGTSLFVEGTHLGPDIVIAVATLDDPAAFPVALNARTARRIPWMAPLRGIPTGSGHDDRPRP